MNLKLTILPGDGIGPEVTGQAVLVLQAVAQLFGHGLSVTRKDIGGAAYVSSKDPLPQDTLQACLSSGAVLLGAVGGPAFDGLPRHLRPEAGLLRLRRWSWVCTPNLRPAICFVAIEDRSPLRALGGRERMDVMISTRAAGGSLFRRNPRSIQGGAGAIASLSSTMA